MHPLDDLAVPTGAVGIHWFGQSSFGLKDTMGTIVLTDPYFPHERPSEKFIHAKPPLHEAALSIHGVLLTHNHGDHTCLETLKRIADFHSQVRYIGPPESVARVMQIGVNPHLITTLEAGGSARLGSMIIHAVWAKPPQGAPQHGIAPPNVTHLGFVVDADGVRVYVSGDPIHTFAEHDELIQPIEALEPDIGLLTTHPTEGEFPFFDGCAKMTAAIGLKAAVPAHYDCFVHRTFDPQEWVKVFQGAGSKAIVMPYDTSLVYRRDN